MAKKKKQKKKVVLNIGFQGWLFIFASLIMAIVFMASTLLLLVGMLPTIIAALIIQYKYRSKVLTIGALNFAGCFPYLLNIWMSQDRVSAMLDAISNPITIIVMYGAAGIGYVLNDFVTKAVKVMMMQSAKKRLEAIEKEKKNLEDRWGRKVRGDLPLDEKGFPIVDNSVNP
ncbi:MAG: hypothetical protein AAF549_04305 [Pseudomonadota bacterium]